MTCSNCRREAIYIYDPRPLTATYYCERCLPSFLRHAAKVGALQTTDSFDRIKSEALAKLSAPAAEVVEPEVAEEPVTAEPEVEAPAESAAPKPRRTRKKKPAAEPAPEAADQS